MFSFIILFLPASTVYAQWTAVSPPDPELSLNAVQLISGEGAGIASAHGGQIVGAGAYKFNTIYSSKFAVSRLVSGSDTTYGDCTLYDNGTFNCFEDEHGKDRNYTGTYAYIGKTGYKFQLTFDANAVHEYRDMLTGWAENMADQEGAEISNISFSFTSVKTSRVTISKKSGIPGKATVTIKGKISAILDGKYITKNFSFSSRITFQSPPPPQQYTLTLQQSGNGSGTVIGTGINCGSDCSEAYASGTSVTLTAGAHSGSRFLSWSGCTSTSGTACTVTMNQNKTVTSTFTRTLPPLPPPPNNYTLDVTKAGTGSGTVTGTGISCGSDCSEAYASGTSVALTAAPSSGSTFTGWSGCDSTNGNACMVTLGQNKTVTAKFTLPQFTLTVQKSGTGSRTVMSSPAGINCGSVCSGNYARGTQVTLTATPSSGLAFINWTECDSTNGNTCTVIMNQDRGVTFSDQRTVLDISPTLQRLIWSKPDGRVDLFEDRQCTEWKGNWIDDDEPHENYCGPTAAMNLLDWYGAPSSYDQLGSEMHTNNWMSNAEAIKACTCFCSPCRWCLCPDVLTCTPACAVLANGFFDVGTHPDDMESTLRKHSPLGSSEGYLLFRHQGNPGLETLEYRLAEGNPVVVLIWNGKTLHWTLVTGTYDANGTVMVRLANNNDLTWDTFVHQWSFEGLNWPVPRLLGDFGIKNFVSMHYEKTTILRSDYGAGFWIGDGMISADGRFRLVLQDDSNLCLRKIENDEAIWCSGTNGTGAQVVWMQTNGNLVMRNSANAVVWQTHTAGATGTYYLALQNDGNLVIYNAAKNKAIWETDTCCH